MEVFLFFSGEAIGRIATRVVGALLLLSGFTPFGQEILVQNRSFENGDFSGWTPNGNVDGSSVGLAFSHSGQKGSGIGSIDVGSVSQTLSTVVGRTYLLSFRIWVDSGRPSQSPPRRRLSNQSHCKK